MALQPSSMLDNGKYEIENVIGRGGFGYVYRARETLTSEIVAVKELVPDLVGDPQIVNRFIQEARATLRLTHSNIARTYHIFRDGSTYYLTMEYLPGGSLAARLAQGRLSVPEVLRIAIELCSALDYAHRQGVVHCDLKPANVLFDHNSQAHLADFGVAHVSDQVMTRQVVTGTGAAIGTVRYMSPEQLEGVRDDPRVDIYALGAMIYEMLAGRPYLDFEDETTPAAQVRNVQRIQRDVPGPLHLVNPQVPSELSQIVSKMLDKDPARRFGSVAEVAFALQRAGNSVSAPHVPHVATEPPPTQIVPPPSRPGTKRSSRGIWLFVGALALVAIAVCAVVGLLLLNDEFAGERRQVALTASTVNALPTRTRIPEPSLPTAALVPTAILPTPDLVALRRERERELMQALRWRSENGPPLFAYFTDQPPQMNGVLDEWMGSIYGIRHVVHRMEDWSGPDDLSGEVTMSWNWDALFMALEIRDDLHVQESSGDTLYNGDDIELQWDAELVPDFPDASLSGDDGQLGIAVTDLQTGAYEAYRWRPPVVEGAVDVSLAARATSHGYIVELAIPWDMLRIVPQEEKPYGFCLSLADNDSPNTQGQETMVSTCPQRDWGDPTTWGTLVLLTR